MINLSKKWSYSIKAVLFVAKKGIQTNIEEISLVQNIPKSILRRIIADLEKTWIIKTIKWRNGWIILWRDLNKISLFDILLASQEKLWISNCTKWEFCDNLAICDTSNIMLNLQKWFDSLLKLYTLDKIIKK